MKYRVILEQDEDGVFVAEVPALPGCISQGPTRVEALKKAGRILTLPPYSTPSLKKGSG